MMRLLVTAGILAALFASVAAASAGGALEKLALRPAQVGPGYTLEELIEPSCLTDCPTLDLCAASFPSERLRTARLQIDYRRNVRKAVWLSNEIATYRKGGGAQARAELERALSTCPSTPVKSRAWHGPTLTYRLTRLHDDRLPAGTLAVRIHATGKDGSVKVDSTFVAIYLFQGDVFSGVYTLGTPGATVSDQIRVGMRAAIASAANLQRA
jgi:hypothetical protein